MFKVMNEDNTATSLTIVLQAVLLILPVPIPDEERKLTYIFIFTLLCGAPKGFVKALKALIKPFEAPQRSVKIKI